MTTRDEIVKTALSFNGTDDGQGLDGRNPFSTNLGRPVEAWCGDYVTDFDGDGIADHVELATGYEGGPLFTIGGNSGPSNVWCTIWYMSSATPREKLLRAVVEVALASGITDMSLRSIAAAAGTSHRMLIHHFGSREGLLVEVIRAVEERQRAAFAELGATTGGLSADMAYQFWEQLRSPGLAPAERLFFEVYGQALQGRPWAVPVLDGNIQDWAGPLAALMEAAGVSPQTARAAARLSVAVSRGLLLDVLATGETGESDAAMRLFLGLLLGRGSGPGVPGAGVPGAGLSGPGPSGGGSPAGEAAP